MHEELFFEKYPIKVIASFWLCELAPLKNHFLIFKGGDFHFKTRQSFVKGIPKKILCAYGSYNLKINFRPRLRPPGQDGDYRIFAMVIGSLAFAFVL